MYYYFTSFLFIFRCFYSFLISKFISVPFFFIYSLFCHFFSFVIQMSPSCASFAYYYFFSFIPSNSYQPLVNPPRRTSRPSELSGKFKSLLPLMLCYYRSRPSQFTVFLPTFPSLLFHGPSNPETNHLPRVLSKLISQGDPGNEFAPSLPRFCDTYISSLRLNARFTC